MAAREPAAFLFCSLRFLTENAREQWPAVPTSFGSYETLFTVSIQISPVLDFGKSLWALRVVTRGVTWLLGTRSGH